MRSRAPPPRPFVLSEQTDGANIIAVEPCPEGMAHQYGIVALEDPRTAA